MKNLFFLTITILLLSICSSFAQNNEVGKKYIYEFRDGTTIIGVFLRQEKGNIYITNVANPADYDAIGLNPLSSTDSIYIPKVMIAQIHEATADNVQNGEYWFPNLHDTRYFFSPSAFGLEEGEGYYSHSYWFLWQAQYGITDDFSIGAGTTPFGIPSSVNAKYSYSINENTHSAIGWFWVGDLFGWGDGDLEALINMPYFVLTKGNRENNISFATGYNFASLDSDFEFSTERLVLNLGATYRTSRRFAFVFEGWLLNAFGDEQYFMGGPGLRYFRKVNRVTARNGAGAKTWDFQLMHFPGMGDGGGPAFVPMFGASRKF